MSSILVNRFEVKNNFSLVCYDPVETPFMLFLKFYKVVRAGGRPQAK